MLNVVVFVLLPNLDGSDRSQTTFMENEENGLNIPRFEVVLWDIHLVFALYELFLKTKVSFLLFDRSHHVDQIPEEGLRSIKSETFLGICIFFFLLFFFFLSLRVRLEILELCFFSIFLLNSFFLVGLFFCGGWHLLEIPDREDWKNMSFHQFFDFFDERDDNFSVAIKFVDASEVSQ